MYIIDFIELLLHFLIFFCSLNQISFAFIPLGPTLFVYFNMGDNLMPLPEIKIPRWGDM